MSAETEPMMPDHHSRAERAALRLVESAGWKISSNVIVTTLLAVCAWSFQGLAVKVNKIAETLTTYAIQSATNDYRMRSVETANTRQDAVDVTQNADIRSLQDAQAALKFRLDNLRDQERARHTP